MSRLNSTYVLSSVHISMISVVGDHQWWQQKLEPKGTVSLVKNQRVQTSQGKKEVHAIEHMNKHL